MPKLSEVTLFTETEVPSGSFIYVAIPTGDSQKPFILYRVSPEIVGATGPQGAQGAQGSLIRNGPGAPLSTTGVDGDYWFDTSTSDLYEKSNGVYSIVANLKGATGATGAAGADGAAASAGGSDTQVQFNDGGAAFGGDAALTFDKTTGELFSENTKLEVESLAYAASVALDFLEGGLKTVSLTGNIEFTTSNKASGRMLMVRVVADGSSRNYTLPAGWTFVGSAAPASIASGKVGVFSLTCFGSNDSDIVAAYAEEP